jgi:carboxyl-terminal processing protease
MPKRVRRYILIVLLSFVTACKKEDAFQNKRYIEEVIASNLIKGVINEINSNYADKIAIETLEEGAINGMLAALDKYSLYINQEEFAAFDQLARGTYLGIGAEIKPTKDGIEILSVIDDSPAFRAQLNPGDIIVTVNGKIVDEKSIKGIVSKLNSDIVQHVVFSVMRGENGVFETSLKKSVVQISSVKTSFVDNIAIIKINYFNEKALGSVQSFVESLHNKDVDGLIIDLRNNPGGMLEQAIGVANMFLTSGKIVEFRSKNPDENRSVFANGSDLFEGKPIAILINRTSASGSELVASALSENRRAIIIGENSYGKGSVQTIIPIPGKGAIKLTTAFLYTPKGVKLNDAGVVPDIAIDFVAKTDKTKEDIAIQKAVDLLHDLAIDGRR